MINATNVAKGCKVISKQSPQIIEEVDKLLAVLINEKQLKGNSMCDEALDIHGDLAKIEIDKKSLGANSNDFDFNASRGWFKIA